VAYLGDQDSRQKVAIAVALQIGGVTLGTLETLGPNVVPNIVKTALPRTLCCPLERALLAVDGHFVSEHASEICAYGHLDPRLRFHRDLTMKSRVQAALGYHSLDNDRYTRILRMHRTGKRHCISSCAMNRVRTPSAYVTS
jgi:hypothetical protein